MVSYRNKKNMKNFIANRIEDSKKYIINNADNSHIFLMQRPDLIENPQEIYVVLHNKKMNLEIYTDLLYVNNSQGVCTVDVFYKDDETFMVRLGSKGKSKKDYPELKRYSNEEIKRMVHLRGLEKKVFYGQNASEPLVYYQPESKRIPECIRMYNLNDVILDLTHLKKENLGYNFPKFRVSIDFKIARELGEEFITNEPITFKEVNYYYRKHRITPYKK
jgi:hypothetical protein